MILTDLPIEINTDLVLRAQGMDPILVKAKSPRLVYITNQAIEKGRPLLEPKVVYERHQVQEHIPTGIQLANRKTIEGDLINKILNRSDEIIIAVCTIGRKIDELVANTFHENPALAMAIEGVGSAATEVLGNTLCNYLESLASKDNLVMSLPIHPGMIGWPLENGQLQIFDILETKGIEVTLESSGLMKPLKSLSMVVGLGSSFDHHFKKCDLCALQKTCLYRQQ
jgi:hypothetical protein